MLVPHDALKSLIVVRKGTKGTGGTKRYKSRRAVSKVRNRCANCSHHARNGYADETDFHYTTKMTQRKHQVEDYFLETVAAVACHAFGILQCLRGCSSVPQN